MKLIGSAVLAVGLGIAGMSIPLSGAEAAVVAKTCQTVWHHGVKTKTCTTQRTHYSPRPVYMAPRPVYVAPRPIYHPRPVYVAPSVVVVHPRHRW